MTVSSPPREVPTPLQQAAIALKEMRSRLDALQAVQEEPIAIVGMSCRYPGGANDPASYWRLLHEGQCATRKVPLERWDADALYDPDPDRFWKMYTRYGCFVDQRIDLFDAPFFNMSPREAAMLDPQQRLLLETSWEALENAGIAPDRLGGSATGVYVGVITGDYGRVPFQRIDPPDLPYMGTGNDMSFAAGRLSYVLGLQGPSMVIATACSSTLATTHLACQALRARECDLALSGGVSLMVFPDTSIVLSKMRATAPDGRSKTFDASADGFGRGEGCGMLVLKRLSDAVRAGDPVLALVRGSAVNHDGQSGGITVPSGPAQEKLLRKALASGRLSPRDVDYLEAHGTGTPLGDPIEVRAIDAVFGPERAPGAPLLIGSVKTNIGHLEAAAGVAGIMKLVLSLQNEELPAHLHFRTPNPQVAWDPARIAVTTERTPWKRGTRPRIAGVSSFGLSGVNAHVLIEEAPLAVTQQRVPEAPVPGPELLALSARSEEALQELTRRYLTWRQGPGKDVPLADVCFTAATGRASFPHRLTVLASSGAQLDERLQAFTSGQRPSGVSAGVVPTGRKPRVAFLFTGQGSQYVGMARELYAHEPRFREVMDRCDELLRSHLGVSLLSVLYPSAGEPGDSTLHDTAYTQPALVALEVALAEQWKHWGVEPSVVMGHSVGEISAAHVAGVLSLEDALLLAATRGRLMQELPRVGGMLAVRAPEERVAALVAAHPRELSIAAVNGPSEVVIAGRSERLRVVGEVLQREGVEVKPLNVSHAFHSPLMEPMLDSFERMVAKLRLRPPELPLISNLTGALVRDEPTTPAYWRRHVREPVRFAAGLRALHAKGADLIVELGPTPVLLGMGRTCLPDERLVWLPSLRNGHSDVEQMRASLAELWVRGASSGLTGIATHGRRSRVPLPNQPFQRKRHWMKLKSARSEEEQARHPLLGRRLNSAARVIQFEGELSTESPAFLADHRVYDSVIVPGATYLEMGVAAGQEVFGQGALSLEDVRFHKPVRLEEGEPRTVQVLVTPDDGEGARKGIFEVHSLSDGAFTLHASGRLSSTEKPSASLHQDVTMLARRCAEEVSVADFYRRIGEHGIDYGPLCRAVTRFGRGGQEAFGQLTLPDALEASEHVLHPVLLDACFQVLGAVFPEGPPGSIYLPVGIGQLRVHDKLGREVFVHARLDGGPDLGQRVHTAHFTLLAPDGRVLAELERLEFQQAPREALLGNSKRVPRGWMYEVAWRPLPLPPATGTPPRERWLIVGDTGGRATDIARRLRASGSDCIVALPGETTGPEDTGTRHVDLTLAASARRLLTEAGPFTGMLHLAALDVRAARDGEPDTFARDYRSLLGSTLHLVRAAAETGVSPRLVLVTRGAQATQGNPLPTPVQACLSGLGKAIAQEHPELRCLRVDLDPAQGTDGVEALVAELQQRTPEDEVCLRGGQRLVSRLARSAEAADGTTTLKLRGDATYLVTGGLGGLGLKLAGRLVERGARNLVLLGRRAPSSEARDSLRELEARGARVVTLQVDISVEAQVTELLARLANTMPPLRGIVHAAAVLDDGMLLQQDLERFERVLGPKALGAWHLHRHTLGQPLDFFVLFSSVASLLGQSGQASYVAANAFLDALAHHRHASGLPALSINWGPWSEVGVAATERVMERVRRMGVTPISPEQGLAAFEQLLGQRRPQVGVVAIGWQSMGRLAAAPYFSELAGVTPTGGATGADFLRRFESAPPGDKPRLLREHIASVATRVLGLDASRPLDPEQGLFEAGMDSLMATELRNALQRTLGRSLPVSLIFDHPSVQALSNHLARELVPAPEAQEVSAAPRDAELESFLMEVNQMSEADVTAALAAGRSNEAGPRGDR
ncbi:type I polyketide synthase [Myxococcus sp. CA039A]|uniref:type I polyketide synthase n=1 Tax=Myxococcus sp. CA039A TaxID=2741737 RepID=UPI00157ADD2F|nr:type I polyketide synthase [Myxococcus sp. CA039A]NTX52451.1 type I polyketide synthase [Myxococcus sp. CA039A]